MSARTAATARLESGPAVPQTRAPRTRSTSDAPAESVEVIVETVKDPVESALQFAILGVIIAGLVGLAYLLFTGVINPPAPRTALEAQLITVREAAKANPASGEVWADYVTALVAVGDLRSAESEYTTAAGVLEGDQLLLLQIAGIDLYLAQEDYEKAFELAEDTVALEAAEREKVVRQQMEAGVHADPKLYGPDIATDTYLGHARAAAALGKWDVVVASLTTALEYTPRAADLYFLRGEAYTELGETDKAIADFNEALRFDPEFEAAKTALSEAGEQ